MSHGYTVVERLQFKKIMAELSLDQTGAVKDNKADKDNTAAALKDLANVIKGTKDKGDDKADKQSYSKSELKKLGELLGISYIVYFGVVPTERGIITNSDWLYIRFINLETAEVEVLISLMVKRKFLDASQPILKTIIRSLVNAETLGAGNKELLISYLDYAETYDKKVNQLKTENKLIYNDKVGSDYIIVYRR